MQVQWVVLHSAARGHARPDAGDNSGAQEQAGASVRCGNMHGVANRPHHHPPGNSCPVLSSEEQNEGLQRALGALVLCLNHRSEQVWRLAVQSVRHLLTMDQQDPPVYNMLIQLPMIPAALVAALRKCRGSRGSSGGGGNSESALPRGGGGASGSHSHSGCRDGGGSPSSGDGVQNHHSCVSIYDIYEGMKYPRLHGCVLGWRHHLDGRY